MLRTALDICNQLVWVGFVYLACRAVLIVMESMRRRARLRSLANDVRAIRTRLAMQFCAYGDESRLTRQQCRRSVLKTLSEVWRAVPNPDLRCLMRTIAESIIHGREEIARDAVERYLADQDGRNELEQQFKDRCLQLGCLGTVLGIFAGFALSDGKTPPLSDLGFALATTAVGLVLSSVIDLALTVVFGSAWCDLRDELEEARAHLWRLWNDRMAPLRDISDEFRMLAAIQKELRELRQMLSRTARDSAGVRLVRDADVA